MYALDDLGALMYRNVVPAPVGIMIAFLASLSAPDPVVVSVQSPEATDVVATPATESSTS